MFRIDTDRKYEDQLCLQIALQSAIVKFCPEGESALRYYEAVLHLLTLKLESPAKCVFQSIIPKVVYSENPDEWGIHIDNDKKLKEWFETCFDVVFDIYAPKHRYQDENFFEDHLLQIDYEKTFVIVGHKWKMLDGEGTSNHASLIVDKEISEKTLFIDSIANPILLYHANRIAEYVFSSNLIIEIKKHG